MPAENPIALRYAAFADPHAAPEVAGNPAGIVLDAGAFPDAEMQRIAHEIGYAETAFVVASNLNGDPRHLRIRYFSPLAEVPFCGHATIATSVVLAERGGTGQYSFDTSVGEVVIQTESSPHGISAAFTSVEPKLRLLSDETRQVLLGLLGVTDADLDERYPVRVAFAGNWHPIVVLRDQHVFNQFSFEPAPVRTLMNAEGWQGTVTVLFAVSPHEFEARNLFPVGAITEDPATGSAAASLGGYLRELGKVDVPTQVIVHQGSHVGRPSLLTVDIPRAGGIVVSGTAVAIA